MPQIRDVRFILPIANKFDLNASQLDIKTAFLHGELENQPLKNTRRVSL